MLNEEKLVQYFKRANLNVQDQIIITGSDKKLDLLFIENKTTKENVELSQTIGHYLFVVE